MTLPIVAASQAHQAATKELLDVLVLLRDHGMEAKTPRGQDCSRIARDLVQVVFPTPQVYIRFLSSAPQVLFEEVNALWRRHISRLSMPTRDTSRSLLQLLRMERGITLARAHANGLDLSPAAARIFKSAVSHDKTCAVDFLLKTYPAEISGDPELLITVLLKSGPGAAPALAAFLQTRRLHERSVPRMLGILPDEIRLKGENDGLRLLQCLFRIQPDCLRGVSPANFDHDSHKAFLQTTKSAHGQLHLHGTLPSLEQLLLSGVKRRPLQAAQPT